MGKLKSKKTLLKRIRVTSTGKLMHGKVNTGHLKVKWSANKKVRKAGNIAIANRGHIKKLRRMLGKNA